MSRRCRTGRCLQGHTVISLRLLLVLLGAAWWVITASTPSPVAAQRRQMQLSLREATAFALQANLDIRIAGLDPLIREAQVTEEKSIFDVEAQAALTAFDDGLLKTSNTFRNKTRVDGLVGQDTTEEQKLSVGIAQLTPFGGTYELEVSEARQETQSQVLARAPRTEDGEGGRGAQKPEFFEGALELRVSQPLLRDSGSFVTKNQIFIAQNNLAIAEEDFRRQIIASTSAVQQTYWDLVFRRQDLLVRQQQLALTERLLAQVRRQVEVGTLAPIEVVQAETDIARVKEQIIAAENAERDTEDRLKRLMQFSLTGEFADVELLPTDAPTYTAPVLNQEAEIAQALAQRHDLTQAKLALENQHITLIFNKNQALPTLDLQGSLRFNGIDDELTGFQQFDPGRRRWEVGLVFRHPLANRAAKSRIEQSRLAIRQQLLRIQDLEERIMEEVRAAVRSILASSQLVQASRAARRLAEKQLEAEEKKLRVGLSTVFFVLQFQQDLADERSTEIRALTAFLQALIRLEEAKNTLLQSYSIIVSPQGPRLQ
jgi:outer membrane protein